MNNFYKLNNSKTIHLHLVLLSTYMKLVLPLNKVKNCIRIKKTKKIVKTSLLTLSFTQSNTDTFD